LVGPREQRVDRRLHFLEWLIARGRNLQTSGPVNQYERWKTHDVAVEVGNIPSHCKQRIAHWNLLNEFLLRIGIFGRQSKNH
jgi:hypothetical protein